MTVAAHNALPDGLSIALRVKGRPREKWRVYFPDVSAKQILLTKLDGKPCAIVLLAVGGVRIYEVKSGGLQQIWTGLERLNPWKVQAADVDGDGKVEIGIGVYKKARFHPVMAKRPFIYGWDGKTLYPKWLGSRLSRPFTDFVLGISAKQGRSWSLSKKERMASMSWRYIAGTASVSRTSGPAHGPGSCPNSKFAA